MLLQAICRLAVEGGGYELAWVGFANQDAQQSVRVAAQSGFDAGYLESLHITWADSERGRGPTGTAIRTGVLQIANDILNDPRMAPWRNDAIARGYRSSIALPLKTDTGVMGTLSVYARETDAFDGEEAALLAELADDLAFGIVTLRARRDHQRAEETMRSMARAIRESDQRFRQIAENILDHVVSLQNVDDLQFSYVSPAYEAIWGRKVEDLYADASEWARSIHPDDRKAVQVDYERQIRGNFELEFRIVRPDGGIRWIHTTGFPVRDDSGEVVRIAGISEDVTARKEAAARIAYLSRVQAMLSGINAIIMRSTSREELFSEACRIAIDKGGLRMAWLGIVDAASQRMSVVASAGADEEFVAALQERWQRIDDKGPLSDTVAAMFRDGEPAIINDLQCDPRVRFPSHYQKAGIRSLVALPLIIANKAAGMFCLHATEAEFFHRDEIALLKEVAGNIAFGMDHLDKQARLDYLAYYDVTTGLANRALFLERVAQHLYGTTGSERKAGILLVDIERFKKINDAFGSSAGDELLRQVAQWFIAVMDSDHLVARVAADQFAVVMPELRQTSDLASRLDSIVTAFSEHVFDIGSESLRIAIKGGVALYPDDGIDAASLFMNAEAALKKAKAIGERFLFFTPKMTAAVAIQIALENRLRRALEEDQFELHYQPKIDLATGALTGVEALIRWNDPQTGLVAPGQFIPVLEETGLINEVGRWALRRAVHDYVRWCNAGLAAVPVAVNVSPLQLRDRHFVDEIRDAVGVDARAAAGLELEITESLIMEDVVHSSAVLSGIRAMGVRIAIDDFGTGFSSLSYLSRLPVDRLKVDRSFIVDMANTADGVTLVSTIVTLAHAMKLNVVAEGVETEQQLDSLRAMGCDEMQGFLFSRPVPADVLEAKFLAPPSAATLKGRI